MISFASLATYLVAPSLVVSLVWVVTTLSHAGESGRRRLRVASEHELQKACESYRRPVIPAHAVSSGVTAAVIGAVAVVRSEPWIIGLCAIAVTLDVLVLSVWRHARPIVLGVAEERDLPPLTYEASASRSRRLRQVGRTTVVLFFGGSALVWLSHGLSAPWLGVLAGTALVLSLLVGSLYLWAATWIYGDEEEQPVP